MFETDVSGGSTSILFRDMEVTDPCHVAERANFHDILSLAGALARLNRS